MRERGVAMAAVVTVTGVIGVVATGAWLPKGALDA